MENIKITIEISDSHGKSLSLKEESIAFAKFAKNYRSPRKVEQAWEWGIKRNRKPL